MRAPASRSASPASRLAGRLARGLAGIAPTPRAVAAMLAVAAASGLAGVWAPEAGRWLLAPAVLLAALMLADVALSASPADVAGELEAPSAVRVGGEVPALAAAGFGRGRRPPAFEAALATTPRLRAEPLRRTGAVRDGRGEAAFTLRARQRGPAAVSALQLRWRGPLGLVHRRLEQDPERRVAVLPDIAGAQALAARLASRSVGLRPDLRRGAEGEFQALGPFPAGGDRRTIDWKRSARHGALLAKETRAERDNRLVLAIDCGRQMVEPVDGRSRLDRAVSAALAAGYAGLAGGDRVRLTAFDARPRQSGPFATGVRGFEALQRLGAEIEPSTEEANHTLALLDLGMGLDRRALVVVFTEFTDTVGAELMLEAAGRLARRHLVMFVVFRDAELEALARVAPAAPEDVSRAVIATDLLRERAVVLERLRRLGVRVVESDAGRLDQAVVDAYFDVKRRGLL